MEQMSFFILVYRLELEIDELIAPQHTEEEDIGNHDKDIYMAHDP